ncbi:MAG: Uma2 family endonuclease [Hymenobacter sp.]|nr:MAG: Uma2 family endonuclease [Hymenobacter sp.]
MGTLEAIKSAYELERGKPMPSKLHGRIQARLIGLLYVSYGQTHTIYSELSITLAPLFAKQVPDIAVYEGLAAYSQADEITVKVSPTLAVEIVSPTQALSEMTGKIEGYLAAGIKSCWIVLPELRSVALSTKAGYHQTFDSSATLRDPVTGIELELAKLFS